MPTPNRFVAITLGLAGLAGFAQPASADDFYREELAMSAETCQAALPAFDGNVRKRPLALMNEGSGSAFVTCGFTGAGEGEAPATLAVRVYLVNTDSAYHTVTCTLVDGGPTLSGSLYVPRALAVPPDGAPHELAWIINDAPATLGPGFYYPVVSCGLEPRTGIAYTTRFYLETF